MTHSPAPWWFEINDAGRFVMGAGRRKVAILSPRPFGAEEVAHADGHCMAASLEMLSALKFAQAMYGKWLDQRWVHLEPDVSDEINELWKAGQAAIAKAEGAGDE